MGHVEPMLVGLVEPWLKVPHNYVAKIFDHNSQSCVEIKWSSNNINLLTVRLYLIIYKSNLFQRMVRDKVAKTDRSKADGALIRRAVDEVPNFNARPIREASIAF